MALNRRARLPRLEALITYVHVDEETGNIDYQCFTHLVGAVLTCFGRPSTHPWEITGEFERMELEEGMPPGYVIGEVVWEPFTSGSPSRNETEE